MSKFINADRLRAELEKERQKAFDSYKDTENPYYIGREDCAKAAIRSVEALQNEQKDQKELPTLREAIEECMYDQLVRKVPTCPDGAGIELRINISRSTARKLKKDYMENGIQATATGKVFTNTDPKLLTVDSDEWQSVLGQFDNGQRVRIILVKEDAE